MTRTRLSHTGNRRRVGQAQHVRQTPSEAWRYNGRVRRHIGVGGAVDGAGSVSAQGGIQRPQAVMPPRKQRSSLFYALVIVGVLLGCGVAVFGSFAWLLKTAYAPADEYYAVRSERLTDVAGISNGFVPCIAMKKDGSLWIWAADTSLLGERPAGVTQTPEPVRVGDDSDWSAIAAGGRHALALKKDGSLWAWGFGEYGQIGDGGSSTREAPVLVGGDARWTSIAAGFDHSVAIKQDGSMWAWGANAQGQLGDSTTETRTVPVRVGSDADWATVVASGSRTIAVKTNGSLWTWGDDSARMTASGGDLVVSTPTRVGADSDWASVGTGDGVPVAIKRDGSLWQWRLRDPEPFEQNPEARRAVPGRLGTAAGWQSAASGSSAGIALKTDGTLWIWGNVSGYVEFLGSEVPLRVGSDTDWVGIASDPIYGIKSDGSMWTFGQRRSSTGATATAGE